MQPSYKYSPVALAFIGDAVYELYVRKAVIASGKSKANELHLMAVDKVRASYQDAAALRIKPMLTQEEAEIYRRGRNCSAVHAPKNADVTQYRRATGLEALIGYLHINGRFERIDELMEVILNNA